MSILKLTESSSGATRNSGTNGDLVALLDWALVTNGGWAINQTATNARVYKPPSGNRNCLFVAHDSTLSGSASLAVVRGCASASAANTAGLVDPFPTVAEVADGSSNWLISSAANTTTRSFTIYVAPTWVAYFSNYGGVADTWDMGWWGDISPALTGSIYDTLCWIRASSSAASTGAFGAGSTGSSTSGKQFLNRSYDGATKAVQAAVWHPSATFGQISNSPSPQAGPSGLIDRQKMQLLDTGNTATTYSSTKGLPCRGWIPNLWLPLHSSNGTLHTRDTFTDTAYNGAATFSIFTGGVGSGGWLIVEDTDTWSKPNG